MNRNRVMRGLGLMALVLLAFGLAGCGSEPAPVARPPAPPPAPPPFQPQAVEVALGESGGTVTLMTTEGGGFTLNGEAFAGGEVTAENDNIYLLALADGTWTAVFQEPAGIEVTLGDHGGTVTITMTEDGKYFIGEMEITADTMVMGENGQYYTPGLDEEGMWVAVWVQPDAVAVMLGLSGMSVMLQQAEDGSYWIGETAIESGGMHTADSGSTYTLTMGEDGMWMAAYQAPAPADVMLGDHGGTVMVSRAEDGSYMIGEMAIESGGMVSGDNGQNYTLTMDEEGMWSGAWVMPDAVAVMLGDHGGSAMLQLAEDGTYWVGETLIESGGMVSGDNGQNYTLTMDDEGMWMGAWVMPDAVAVMLGDHGGSAMLQLAEDGTYWVGETLIESGGMVTGENGHYYTLTMDDEGMWMGAWVMPDAVAVMLGDHGGSVMVQLAEDGSYSIGEMAIESGSTYTAINGNDYTLTMDDEGMWSGMYMVVTEMVTLGTHGGTITLSRLEDGSYMYGEMMIEQGSVVMMNDRSYALTMDDEGMWSAMYVAGTQMVTLGAHGGTITLSRLEDGSYMHGEMMIEQGSVVMMNDRSYALMMGDDGMWSAEYNPVYVELELGTAGSVELKQAEDMRWWIGEVEATDGYVHTADNGNEYTLSMDDEGMWNPPQFKPMSMEIMGTGGLMAMTREADDMYDVGDTTLPESGMGDITVYGETYRVVTMDGDLMGTRLDPVSIDGDTDFKTIGLAAMPTIPGDEDDTEDVNESMTTLKVGGDEYTFADLLADGMAEGQGDNFVADAREDLEGIREKIVAVLDVFDEEVDRDREVTRLWGTRPDSDDDNRDTNVKGVLAKVFGTAEIISEGPDDNDALDAIDELIDALSSVDGLAAALEDDGVFEAVIGDMTAEEIFDATSAESTVSYGMTAMTRYGAISKKVRDNAVSKARFDFDEDMESDDDGDGTALENETIGELGAFAFGVTAETVRARHIATSGNAYYEGGTMAINGDGMHFEGDIAIRVRFATEKVDGLITNLETADGEPWVHLFDEVESIVLATANMSSNTMWSVPTTDNQASITFALRAGSPGPQMVDSTFNGRLLGTGDDAGSQAVGTWSVGTNPSSSTYIAGGFGAELVSDEPDRRPAGDDGTATETTLTVEDGMTALEDGMLTINVRKFGWTRTGALGDNGSRYEWAQQDDGDDDTPGDTTDAMRKYEISLADLVAGEGSEYNMNGGNYVMMAREMIEKERGKLAVLIDSDQLEDAQANIWMRVQEILLVYVFDAGATGDFMDRLPDQVGDAYDADTALETIDDIIDALSSASNLEAALDKDEDALFVQDDDTPFVGRGAGDIFNENDSQAKALIGTTDFTRFGVWRVQRSRNAQRGASAEGVEDAGWQIAETETFAYSPLPATEVTSTASPNYTPDGSATYEGSTVAYVGTTGYEGDVDVYVTWNLNTVGGTIQTVISNMRNAGNGDDLLHGSTPMPVRNLVFDDLSFTADTEDNLLDFAASGTTDIRVEYMDRNEPTGDASANVYAGTFVGSSADGPLGVIGRYSIGESTFRVGADDEGPSAIMGAFGAELP